jgi:hypothetical protein
MMFLDCPAYLDQYGAARCGLPAEVRCRFAMRSTDGPIESAMIRCPAGHYFCGAIESLTCDNSRQREAWAASSARHGSITGGHDGPDGSDGLVIGNAPEEQEQEISCPNSAPAYYQGRPARLWITAMSPRHSRAASNHLAQAVNGPRARGHATAFVTTDRRLPEFTANRASSGVSRDPANYR